MNKKELIPKRRFKEFENAGAWEQRKLGEVAEKFDNLRIPITAAKRKKGVTPYYGANGIQDYVEGYTHNGEFVLVAEDGANDLQNYPVHYVSGKIWVNNHAHVLQGKNRIADNLFLLNAIKKIQFETYLVGGSRAKLNADTMMKLPIKLPGFKEQQELGKYFYKLDNLIALHQRKLNKLKKMKSACLTEMFPAEGEREPKRRFPGFTGAWEQRKLSDFSKTTYGGGTPKTAVTEYWDGNIPWIQSSNLTVDDVQEVNLDKFITDDAIKNSAAKLIPANSIAIVTRVGVGKLTLMKQEFATSQDFLSLSELHVDEQFGLYSIYKLLQKELNNIQGTSIKGMTKGDLLTKDIMIPVEKDEQIKIGSFFKQLDHLITLHQRKLDKIKKMKLAYLNELFV